MESRKGAKTPQACGGRHLIGTAPARCDESPVERFASADKHHVDDVHRLALPYGIRPIRGGRDKVLQLGSRSFSVQKMPDIITSREMWIEMNKRKDIDLLDVERVEVLRGPQLPWGQLSGVVRQGILKDPAQAGGIGSKFRSDSRRQGGEYSGKILLGSRPRPI